MDYGYFDLPLGQTGVYHDTLFVGGGFNTAGEDTVMRIAEWTARYMDSCSVSVGMQELGSPMEPLRLWPNPVVDELNVSSSTLRSGEICIEDALGRVVFQQHWCGSALDVRGLASGLYRITINDPRLGLAAYASILKQ